MPGAPGAPGPMPPVADAAGHLDHALADAIIASSPEAIVLFDETRRIHFANEAAGLLLGLDAAVDPQLNIGGILNQGAVSQDTTTLDRSNSGIVQSGCGAGGCFSCVHRDAQRSWRLGESDSARY